MTTQTNAVPNKDTKGRCTKSFIEKYNSLNLVIEKHNALNLVFKLLYTLPYVRFDNQNQPMVKQEDYIKAEEAVSNYYEKQLRNQSS